MLSRTVVFARRAASRRNFSTSLESFHTKLNAYSKQASEVAVESTEAAESAVEAAAADASHAHGHAAPVYEGMEASLRSVLPEDHHIVLATWGAVAGLIALFKIKGAISGGEEENDVVADDGVSSKSSIPSIFSEKYEAFSAKPGADEKWSASLEKWEKGMENAAYAAKWEKSLA